MSFDLTNKNISDTFQNLLQKTGSDGSLYTLDGTQVGDLKIAGNLIAEQYIVSSSVTYITSSCMSGSTTFGDSLDDTHTFTGSIGVTGSVGIGNPATPKALTVSGSISASSHLYLSKNDGFPTIYFNQD